MESYGVAKSIYESIQEPRFGVIRCVSDKADSKKNDEFRFAALQTGATFLQYALTFGALIIDVPKTQ